MTLEQMLMIALIIAFAGCVLYAVIQKVDESNPFKHSRKVDDYRSSMRDHSLGN
jgi:hypothetical protein